MIVSGVLLHEHCQSLVSLLGVLFKGKNLQFLLPIWVPIVLAALNHMGSAIDSMQKHVMVMANLGCAIVASSPWGGSAVARAPDWLHMCVCLARNYCIRSESTTPNMLGPEHVFFPGKYFEIAGRLWREPVSFRGVLGRRRMLGPLVAYKDRRPETQTHMQLLSDERLAYTLTIGAETRHIHDSENLRCNIMLRQDS